MDRLFEVKYWKKSAQETLESAIKYRLEGRQMIQDNIAQGARVAPHRVEGLYRSACAEKLNRAITKTRIALRARPVTTNLIVITSQGKIEGAFYAK